MQDFLNREDKCLIAHNLLDDHELSKALDRSDLDSVDSGVLDSGDAGVIDLMKSMHELNGLLEEVASWSRLTSACCAVVMNGDDTSPEEESFSTRKKEELRDKAEELKNRLEEALPLLKHVTEQCAHSEHLRDISDLIEKFLAFTKDVDTSKSKLEIKPTLLQDVHVLGSQLEKLLNRSDDNLNEFSDASINGENTDVSPSKEDNVFKQFGSIEQWIDVKLDELNQSAIFGGLPETAQSLLDKHLIFQREVEEKQSELSEILSANEIEDPLLEARMNRLLNSCRERKEKLEENLAEAIRFHDNLHKFMNWLGGAERVMKSTIKAPISVLPEKVSQQITDHVAFEETLKDRRLELLELDKLGSQLKYFSQKQDGILIKNLLLSVHSRWDKLLAAIKSHSASVNDIHKKSKQFWETSSDLLSWIESALRKLSSGSSLHIDDTDLAEEELQIYEEFQKALSSKQPVYNVASKSGAALREKAMIDSDRNLVDEELQKLKENWNKLQEKSRQRKNDLDDSINFSEMFSDAINSILEWLYEVEPTLSGDMHVHGDIHTVDNLIHKHQLLKADLEQRHIGVVSLQQSLCKDQGDEWKNDHLQDLLVRWNVVSELVDKRQDELNEAEELAKDLHLSSENLFTHLSKVEKELYSNPKLPQDEFQLQELKALHQATVSDLQDQQEEFDRIVNLAHFILDRAHSDAVIPLRHMIKLLQTKWFEVQTRAHGRADELDKRIKEIEDDLHAIEMFKKWLAVAEQKLKQQNQQTLSPDEVEKATAELQAFQDEMVTKQPDYDKLIGRYTPRKSQTYVKKSPRGKPQKGDEADNPMKLNCEKLQAQWSNVWLLTLDRQKRIQEAKTHSHKEPKAHDFNFEPWRKRFMKWLKHRKIKPMEFFRAMDKDGDGTLSREEFIQGMLKSNFPAKETEMRKICEFFEQDSGEVMDYYKLVGALYPAHDMGKLVKEADQIENEVVRQVSKCTCAKRFNVHQIAENKFRFGDNHQLRLVRILKSTVMVRVGGGWMALDEFLTKYDPCRAKRRTNTELREKFVLPSGASQSMSAFRSSRASKAKSPP